MKLVVIEAPAKRDTLKKYLGEGYEVFATKGHIRDLPTKSFSIDLNNNYEPHYEDNPDKKELIAELLKPSHRPYTTGFYYGENDRQYRDDSKPMQTEEFVGVVAADSKDGFVEVEMRNKFSVGDVLGLLSVVPKSFNKQLKITKIINSDGEEIETAKRVQEIVKVPCKYELKKGDILRR